MKRYRFNEKQRAEYNRRVREYCNESYYRKDARAMARRDVEDMIFVEERDRNRVQPSKGG